MSIQTIGIWFLITYWGFSQIRIDHVLQGHMKLRIHEFFRREQTDDAPNKGKKAIRTTLDGPLEEFAATNSTRRTLHHQPHTTFWPSPPPSKSRLLATIGRLQVKPAPCLPACHSIDY